MMARRRERVELRAVPIMRTLGGQFDLVIEKWTNIVKILEAGKRPTRLGCDSCGFCVAYVSCRRCPIHRDTGVEMCFGTPYDTFETYIETSHYSLALKHARLELAYLKDLRRRRQK